MQGYVKLQGDKYTFTDTIIHFYRWARNRVHRLKNSNCTQKAFSGTTKELFPPNLKNSPNKDLQEEAVLI